MVLVRQAFSNTLAPGFRKVVFDTYKERPIEGKTLVNVQTSKRAYEDDFQVTGFGTLRRKPEGGRVPYEDPRQGATKRYLWDTYALGFRITLEMMEDDLYGIVGTRLSKALARSARNNYEIIAHSPFNNAFDNTVNGFGSGEALCDTHTLIKGGTITNKPATATDFSLPALQAGLEHFHSLTDEAGMPVVYIPKRVIHSIGDYWIVNQTLKSPSMPGGNLNDINQVNREGLSPHLSHYLTDPDAWFIQCDMHDINFFERRPFTLSNSDDFRTKDAEFTGLARRGVGFGDWRGIYGSAGE